MKSHDAAGRRFLDSLPARNEIQNRIRQYMPPTLVGAPLLANGRSFEVRYAAGQPVTLTMITPDSQRRELVRLGFGPAFPGVLPSPDGRYVLYWGGPRLNAWRVLDVDGNRTLPDSLTAIVPNTVALAWVPDGSGFYYVRRPSATEPSASAETPRVFYHAVQSPQSDDRPVFVSPQPDVRPFVSDDGRRVIFITRSPDANVVRVHVAERDGIALRAAPRLLTPPGDAHYAFVGTDSSIMYFITTRGSPRGRVVAIDVNGSAAAPWKTIIPQSDMAILSADLAGDRVVVTYSRDAQIVMRVFARDGQFERELPLPGIGSTWNNAVFAPGLASTHRTSPVAYFSYLAANHQPRIYRVNVQTGDTAAHFMPRLAYDPARYELRHVVVRTTDGTRIPIFLGHKRGLRLDGSAPMIVDVVSAGRTVALSTWAQSTFMMMEMGGVHAMIGTRGGWEYGEEWRRAGSGAGKELALRDYLAGIDWLVREGYTKPGRIVAIAAGASSVFPLAAMNRRRELFAAVMVGSPVTDLLNVDRYPGGDQLTGDFAAASGEAKRDRRLVEALGRVSPYECLRKGACYPPVLLTAGEFDTVYPAHAYKYVAKLEDAQGCDRPVVLQVQWGGGFTGFTGNFVDAVAFAMKALGMPATLVPTNPT